MPNLDLATVPHYEPLQPYYFSYDNLPIDALIFRQNIINNQVDYNTNILQLSIGSQPSLNVRLSQSINDDGTLITSSVDEALHNIGYHEDGSYNDVDYVRMKLDEREKLALIANSATSLSLKVTTESNIVILDDIQVELVNSDSLTWKLTEPNKLSADLNFPIESAHQHYYGVTPEPKTLTPDYINYKTGSYGAFKHGTLRVYINGVRIVEDADTLVPDWNSYTTTTFNSFTSDVDLKGFALTTAITENDVIRIDFDISLV